MVQAHLRCKGEPGGEGCTVKPDVLKGLRGLVGLGVGDLLLYAGDYKKLFAERVEVFIHCDAKTITRAFRSIARDTDLVVRVGRRWLFRGGDLQLEDSELLRAIRERTARVQGGDARSSVETDRAVPTASIASDQPVSAVAAGYAKDSELVGRRSIVHDGAPQQQERPVPVDDEAVPRGPARDTATPDAAPADGSGTALPPPGPKPPFKRSSIQWKYIKPIPTEQAASQYVGRKKARVRDPTQG